ncbi:hypothetical protein [Microbacterium hominis]|uniref:Uncharacterized protein n=1 Tax=Microbacterium hominis TaxID=162426 RepID=A0A7D4PVM4_9MICO|nr:hypothetical protein [Microbacterium hominis]QKJ20693.1 hypothetical protein HQM25_15925 [Microbacterium hominis]
MPSTPFHSSYDPDRWIPVPLDYVGTPWADAQAWAAWIAQEASAGRDDAAELLPAIAHEAQTIALFPAAHVSFRFWHYPVDGEPTGFVDVYVQERDPDTTAPADLLPEPGFTAVDPVVEELDIATFPGAVRRLTLNVVLRDEESEPVLFPKAEWLGVRGRWVAYAVSGDHDVARLRERLDDIDALFASLDPAGDTA